MILSGYKLMRFAGDAFTTDTRSDDLIARDYSARDKAEDQMLLRALQRGEMGQGPQIDKAIQDIINRINGVGQVRGI